MKLVGRNFLNKHRYLLQNTIFVFATNALQSIFSFATVYVLVWNLSQEQFGDDQFILSIIGVITILSLPGLNNAVMQSTAGGMKGTFCLSLMPWFLSSLIGSLILFGIGIVHILYGNSELSKAFYIAAIFFRSLMV